MSTNAMGDVNAKIRARIAALVAERDQFVQDANTKVVAINTAIAELESLLEEAEEDIEDDDD